MNDSEFTHLNVNHDVSLRELDIKPMGWVDDEIEASIYSVACALTKCDVIITQRGPVLNLFIDVNVAYLPLGGDMLVAVTVPEVTPPLLRPLPRPLLIRPLPLARPLEVLLYRFDDLPEAAASANFARSTATLSCAGSLSSSPSVSRFISSSLHHRR